MAMIHRRALITGLLASVTAPALARLTQGATTVYYTPYVGDGILYQLADFAHNTGRTPYGWLTYWDGEYICRREVSWDEVYEPHSGVAQG